VALRVVGRAGGASVTLGGRAVGLEALAERHANGLPRLLD
jgi:hypothetical protein